MRIRLPKSRSRAPVAIAAFIGMPLFFSSLMAATLALEKPHTIQWSCCGYRPNAVPHDAFLVLTTWHDPATATVARAWLWAMMPPLVLLLIGAIATRLPLGFYIPCIAAVPIAMAVVHKTATWERHHTARFRNGVDLIPASNPQSNKFDPGQWESMARQTALSLQHWTIALALASGFVMAALYVRRRYFARKPVQAWGQIEGIHAPDATPPGLGDPQG
jgi:hypothetical protein